MTRDDLDRLAAEHVIGLLDGDERGQAERMLAEDPAFQEAVLAWQSRFFELDDTAPAIPPDDALWARIDGSLPAQAPARTAAPAPVLIPDPASAFKALWRNLAFWRAAGLAGAFATLALAVGLGLLAERSARKPVMIAVLMTSTNIAECVINAYADGRAEMIPFSNLKLPAGRALEIWAISAQTQTPISVGVMTVEGTIKLDLQRVPGLRENQAFAASLEPPTGSTTGAPSGPVVMRGTALTAL